MSTTVQTPAPSHVRAAGMRGRWVAAIGSVLLLAIGVAIGWQWGRSQSEQSTPWSTAETLALAIRGGDAQAIEDLVDPQADRERIRPFLEQIDGAGAAAQIESVSQYGEGAMTMVTLQYTENDGRRLRTEFLLAPQENVPYARWLIKP